jgi:hypothetical protein
MRLPIDVFGSVSLSHEGMDILLTADGSRIVVAFPSVRDGIRSVSALLIRRGWLGRLDSFNSALTQMGLSLYFKAGHVSGPVLGVEARHGLVPALADLLRRYKHRLAG